MAVNKQKVTDTFAVYQGDCIDVMPELKDASVHLSIYSPPFSDLYNYSSSARDLSNCSSYEDFFTHYSFVVEQISRLTVPGRLSVVHCTDLKFGSGIRDFPGDIIRLHEKHGFIYHDRHCVWKEPLRVAIRTRSLGLMHKQIVKDSSLCRSALADYILVFRKKGTNQIPIAHPLGFSEYFGDRDVPSGLVEKYKGWKNPKTNKLSHWIWQQYASSFWDDIRVNRVLSYKAARDSEEEKHVCPLQLDVIDRCLVLWSNLGDVVLTPFMGVGSEVYGAVRAGRKGIGIELKESYYRQAVRNILHVKMDDRSAGCELDKQEGLFESVLAVGDEM